MLRKKKPVPTRLLTPLSHSVAEQRTSNPSLNEPEKLVGIGYRCWLAGYETGDIGCWETGWNHMSKELGTKNAKSAVSELSCWIRTLRNLSCRKLNYYPYGCAGFCHDECMAISMVAASQHQHCPAMKACAFALLGSSMIDSALEATQGLAGTLKEMDQHLSATSICKAVVDNRSSIIQH